MPELLIGYRNNHTNNIVNIHVVGEDDMDSAVLAANNALGTYYEDQEFTLNQIESVSFSSSCPF